MLGSLNLLIAGRTSEQAMPLLRPSHRDRQIMYDQSLPIIQSQIWIDQSPSAIMELNQLRTFIAVAEMGHLTQAAERIHMSQPAASAHIKALKLAARLFAEDRRFRNVDVIASHDVSLGAS